MFSPLTPDSTVNKFYNSFQGGKGARLQLGEHLESDFDFYNCFTLSLLEKAGGRKYSTDMLFVFIIKK